MNSAIDNMVKELQSVLGDSIACIYLFGSVAMGDFKLGWSDIDIICLTKRMLSDDEAEELVNLRQKLLECDKTNRYYRSFEGIITSVDEFINNAYTKAVYWGTSGQRITDSYSFDECSLFELIKYGRLVLGEDIRDKMVLPTYEELKNNVMRHYRAIREYAALTNESLYSCGWLLDIARCIYTLRFGDVISKTKAGEWALEENICPDREQMIKTLKVRNEPLKYKDRDDTKRWLASLGPTVQEFADVLETELDRHSHCI